MKGGKGEPSPEAKKTDVHDPGPNLCLNTKGERTAAA